MSDSAKEPTIGVSVIVPCFNRADTVEEAVRSVLDQDWPDLEVIAVDDGSEDDTWAVLQGIADPRLRCLRHPAKGVSRARNYGVAQATKPWIGFQDSDDIWLPGKLEKQMARLADSSFVAAYCGMLVKADARPETPVQKRIPDPAITPLEGDILSSLCRDSYISTQMLIIRRDIFDDAGGFDAEIDALEDWELMLRVAQRGPVAFVDEDLVVQRMSENSITRSSRKRLVAHGQIIAKHAALFAHYPRAKANHHHCIAGAHRRFGEFGQAAHHARAALGSAPFNLRYLLNLIFLRARAFLNRGINTPPSGDPSA